MEAHAATTGVSLERVAQLREELLAEEEELTSVQQRLLGQDEDLRACFDRVGTLESSILAGVDASTNPGLETPPPTARRWGEISFEVDKCSSRHARSATNSCARTTPKNALGPPEPRPAPASPRMPPPRPASLSGLPQCGTPSLRNEVTPKPRGTGKLSVDACQQYTSLAQHTTPRETVQPTRISPCTIRTRESSGTVLVDYVEDRIYRAERRTEAAHEARQAAEAAAALAEIEARKAHDATERLRLEALEMSRWREAVLQVREMLESVEGMKGTENEEGDGRKRDFCREGRLDDPVARHSQWVSSPVLGTLLPRLQQSARELLSDLAAARCRGLGGDNRPGNSVADSMSARARARSSAYAGADTRCGCRPCPHSATEIPRVMRDDDEQENMQESLCHHVRCSRDGATMEEARGCMGCSPGTEAELAVSREEAPMTGATCYANKNGSTLSSLRNECETLRIVVQALREKDEESQAQISMLQEDLLQLSLEAVKRDALLSCLRKRDHQHQLPHDVGSADNDCFRAVKLGSSTPKSAQLHRHCSVRPRNTTDCEFTARLGERRTSPYSREVGAGKAPPVSEQPRITPRPTCAAGGVSTTPKSDRCRSSRLCTSVLAATPTRMRDQRSWTAGKIGSNRSVVCNPVAGSVLKGGDISPGRESRGSVEGLCRFRARTPTTDILRRLLYESTPMSGERQGEGRAWGTAEALRVARSRQSELTNSGPCRSRRLFCEEVEDAVTTPTSTGDCEAEGRRRLGPKVLFSKSPCRYDTHGGKSWGNHATRNEDENQDVEIPSGHEPVGEAEANAIQHDGGCGRKEVGYAAGHPDASLGIERGSPTTGKVLRERLLQARRDFSVLRRGISTHEL